MGLDICVGHPSRDGNSIHHSYSGFAAFRRRIARQIGIDLDRMVGFGGRRSWAKIADPLAALLNHSDCGGKISPKACRAAALRLREVVMEMSDPEDGPVVGFGEDLAELMEECAKRRMWLHFC